MGDYSENTAREVLRVVELTLAELAEPTARVANARRGR